MGSSRAGSRSISAPPSSSLSPITKALIGAPLPLRPRSGRQSSSSATAMTFAASCRSRTGSADRPRRPARTISRPISHLYATSFVGQVTDWCTRHGCSTATPTSKRACLSGPLDRRTCSILARLERRLHRRAVERARMPVDFKEAAPVAHFEAGPSWWRIRDSRPRLLLEPGKGSAGHQHGAALGRESAYPALFRIRS